MIVATQVRNVFIIRLKRLPKVCLSYLCAHVIRIDPGLNLRMSPGSVNKIICDSLRDTLTIYVPILCHRLDCSQKTFLAAHLFLLAQDHLVDGVLFPA